MSVVAAHGDERTLIVKGALKNVLDVCATIRVSSNELPIGEQRAILESRLEQWNDEGFRVLGVASRPIEDQPKYSVEDERALVLEGFLLFFDPPKEDCARVISALEGLGIELKVLTGDSRGCAIHLANAVGIPSDQVITGSELRQVLPQALGAICERTKVFAELDPAQKEHILLAIKQRGHVVGYLGDGINDAPALHAADVSISVDGAVDVAKDAADFVLGRRDLDVLRAGVEAGRVTFANTLKYVRTTTSANFGNMVSMAVASLYLPFLPLVAGQILLNNFLSDIPQSFVATDRVDPEVTRRPGRWSVRGIRDFMIVFGLVSSVFDILTFVGLRWLDASVDQFRTVWFIESLLTELGIAVVVRTSRPAWSSTPGRALLLSSVIVVAFTFAIPYSPIATTFSLVPLAGGWLVSIGIVTVAYLATSELVKRVYVRAHSFEGQ